MKNLFTLVAVMAAFTFASAQVTTMKSQWGGTTDSITNTGTAYLKAQVSGTGTVTIYAVMTKLSGTGAGTAILQGSVDGTNWTPVSFSTGLVTGGGSTGAANDTFTLTNVTTQTCYWFLNENQHLYYRVYWTGSGTELVRVSAKAMLRKKP